MTSIWPFALSLTGEMLGLCVCHWPVTLGTSSLVGPCISLHGLLSLFPILFSIDTELLVNSLKKTAATCYYAFRRDFCSLTFPSLPPKSAQFFLILVYPLKSLPNISYLPLCTLQLTLFFISHQGGKNLALLLPLIHYAYFCY